MIISARVACRRGDRVIFHDDDTGRRFDGRIERVNDGGVFARGIDGDGNSAVAFLATSMLIGDRTRVE